MVSLTVEGGFDITGVYRADGRNPEGRPYQATVQVAAVGQTYLVRWWVTPTEYHEGVGILVGHLLSVAYQTAGQTGLAVYQVQPGPRLDGRWAQLDGRGTVQTELLTFAGKK